MQLLFCSRNVSPMGCARALSRPDKRKEMFTAFSKMASSKLKEFDKKLDTNLNGELKVSVAPVRVRFLMSQNRPLHPLNRLKNQWARKRRLVHEKKAVKLGTQIYPAFKTKVHLITSIEICRFWRALRERFVSKVHSAWLTAQFTSD